MMQPKQTGTIKDSDASDHTVTARKSIKTQFIKQAIKRVDLGVQVIRQVQKPVYFLIQPILTADGLGRNGTEDGARLERTVQRGTHKADTLGRLPGRPLHGGEVC